jgi:glutamate 5-kinase
LGLANRPKKLAELQATAAVGQGLVMHAYQLAFAKYNMSVGQVLLTSDDLDHRQRYVNAQNTLDQLFRLGVVPIVNENDSVAVEELQLFLIWWMHSYWLF